MFPRAPCCICSADEMIRPTAIVKEFGMGTKQCKACGIVKPLDQFHSYTRKKGGRLVTGPYARCIPCGREYDRSRAKHLRVKQRRLIYQEENKRLLPTGYQYCSKCFYKKALSEFGTSMPNRQGNLNKICDTCLTQLYSYKSNTFSPEFWRRRAYASNCVARHRLRRELGKPIELSELPYVCKPQDLADLFAQQKGCCAYCGGQLEPIMDRHRNSPNAVSIDHKESMTTGGKHEKANLIICCYACNSLKAGMGEQQFREFLPLYAQRVLKAVELWDKEPIG
jgi:5-methylcytosine-specific restriction endonuclease McrA